MSRELERSYDFCQALSRRTAKNFYYSFLVLPRERRRAMCALYAFMRQTDDIADEPGDPALKAAALRTWRADLDSALAGHSTDWPGYPALAEIVRAYQVPPRHLHDVIDGVEIDLHPWTVRSFDDLYPYCYRVASAVGLCCIHLWGFESDSGRAEQTAEANGLALQLTNILRDVREDALNGRVYLPQDELERFGVRPGELAEGPMNDRLRDLFRFQADRAYEFYRKAEPLAGLVSPSGRSVLGALTSIYRGLLDEIVRRDYDVLSRRVSLSPANKLWKTFRALVARKPDRGPVRVESGRC